MQPPSLTRHVICRALTRESYRRMKEYINEAQRLGHYNLSYAAPIVDP